MQRTSHKARRIAKTPTNWCDCQLRSQPLDQVEASSKLTSVVTQTNLSAA